MKMKYNLNYNAGHTYARVNYARRLELVQLQEL